jgi:baculoviral IAP repeat-containing protein 6
MFKIKIDNQIIIELITVLKKIHATYIKLELELETKTNSDKDIYINTLKGFQFELITDLPNVCSNNKKLLSNIRLGKEINILSKSLPMDYESSIYLRVDENNMQSMHALIIPSSGTPYENGCFLFHIFIPDTFPNSPPLVQIVTTGRGTVRFNPNLYACGKVCLSLLGTWKGDPSESWNQSSTILQVLISIQSLIFIEQPYFNEPGYESHFNTPHGHQKSNEYNTPIRLNTVQWAMINQLKNLPKGFENVILQHFKLKKNYILNQVKNWFSTTESFKTKPLYDELVKSLNNL